MSTMVVDISDVQASIRDFPNHAVEAEVKSAKRGLSQTHNLKVDLELEIYHPDVGTAIIRDNLPAAFPAKVKAFWMAINDLTSEDMAEQTQVEIDPAALVGARLIVQLGEQESKTNGKIYKTIVAPWYYPTSRTDVLEQAYANSSPI